MFSGFYTDFAVCDAMRCDRHVQVMKRNVRRESLEDEEFQLLQVKVAFCNGKAYGYTAATMGAFGANITVSVMVYVTKII